MSKDENPQRVNEMDSPSSEGFHTQLDCKVTSGNKSQTQLGAVIGVTFKKSLRLVFLPTLLPCSSRFLRASQQTRLLHLLNIYIYVILTYIFFLT